MPSGNVFSEYDRVLGDAISYNNTLISKLSSAKKNEKTQKRVESLIANIQMQNKELESIRDEVDTIRNADIDSMASIKKEASNNRVHGQIFPNVGALDSAFNQLKGKINRGITALTASTNKVISTLKEISGPIVNATKIDLDRKLKKITSSWSIVQANATTKNMHAVMNIDEAASCYDVLSSLRSATFEAVMNDILPGDDAMKLISMAEAAANDRITKSVNMKLSIYESYQEGKITESERDNLLMELESI